MRHILILLPLILLPLACTNSIDNPTEPDTLFDEDYWATSTDTAVTGQASDITYYSATLTGKLNIRSFNALPQYSTWGMLLSTNPNPAPDDPDTRTIASKRQAKIFTVNATSLTMGTRYYYRAYLRESRGSTIRLGHTMYFTTLTCNVTTLPATPVSIFSATLRGESSVRLNDTKFQGEAGFLYTTRQTDRPNPSVDTFIKARVSDGDSTHFEASIPNLQPSQSVIYQAYLKIDTTYYYGAPLSLTTSPLTIQDTDLPVDLGLTTLWSARNVGATSAELAGTYFAWGDPTGELTSSNVDSYPSESSIVATSYDMATANLGAGWQMPTFEQLQELVQNCDWAWTTYRDTQGYAIVSRVNSNAIFLPAAGYAKPLDDDGREILAANIADPIGYYWSGSLSSFSRFAYSLKISSSKIDIHQLDNEKSYAYTVRAVLADD